MKVSTKKYRAQLEAAYTLLEGDTTTLAKFEKIKTLVSGISPALDAKLSAASKALAHLKAVQNLDVIHFATGALPDKTPEGKKRKKALVLFISTWKSLKSEVARVKGYSVGVSSAAKTATFAKGPFGLVTLAAVAIVGVGIFLKNATSDLTIENIGCPPMVVPKIPLEIPGLKLPESPIIPGNPVTATLPALSAEITVTKTLLTATALGQTGSYVLPAGTKDVRFDNLSLIGKTTTLKLTSSSPHTFVIECN